MTEFKINRMLIFFIINPALGNILNIPFILFISALDNGKRRKSYQEADTVTMANVCDDTLDAAEFNVMIKTGTVMRIIKLNIFPVTVRYR